MPEYIIPITKNRVRASQIPSQTEDNYSDNIVNSYGELVLAGYDWAEAAIDIQGSVAHDAADSGNPIKVGGKARSSQLSAVSNNDRSDLVTNVYGELVLAGFDWSATALKMHGAVAHDAVDSGNPIKLGGKASTSLPSAVSNNDRVNAYFDTNGRLHVYEENTVSTGNVAHDAVDSGNPIKVGFRARTSQTTAVSNNDRSDGITNAYGELVLAGYSWSEAAIDVHGSAAHDAADSGNPIKIGGRARTSQIAAVANNDRSDLVTNAYGELVVAGFDWITNAISVEITNPDSQQYVGEIIADVDPAPDTTVYYYIDMDGYSTLTLQWVIDITAVSTTTITIEGTLQDDGTAPSSCTYIDITQYGFVPANAVTAPSFTDTSNIGSIGAVHQYKYIRIKVVTAGGSADADYTIWAKKTNNY